MAEAPEGAGEGEGLAAEDGPGGAGGAELGAGEGSGAHPVVGEDLVEAARRAAAAEEVEPEGVVLAEGEGGHLDLAEMRRVVDRGQAADDVALEKAGIVHGGRGMDGAEGAARGVLAAVSREAERGFLPFHEGELAGELLRAPAVVGVEEGEIAAAGGADGAVAGGGGALAVTGGRAGKKADAGVAGGGGGGDRRRFVGGAVVGDQHLPVRKALGGDRGDGRRKRGGGVPGRGDDGDGGVHAVIGSRPDFPILGEKSRCTTHAQRMQNPCTRFRAVRPRA